MYAKHISVWWLIATLCAFSVIVSIVSTNNYKVNCGNNGVFENHMCVCTEGWHGPLCQFCGGKVRLKNQTGIIYDGSGNYSLSNKCSWLIDAPNSSITLHFEDFSTECGWDYLYVFDGDNVDAPLVAALSGLMYNHQYGIRKIPEIIVHSGAALIHFSSDGANNLSGFNLTYRLNSCPSTLSSLNCSGNGECINESCICDRGWTGLACQSALCPNNCGNSEKKGICEPELGCSCYGDNKGNDCSQIASDGYWETVTTKSFPRGSASHAAVIWRDTMYVVGGESYDAGKFISIYNFSGNNWETLHIMNGPSPRYGHSAVLYKDQIFLYGGTLETGYTTSELWIFDIISKTWKTIATRSDSCNISFQMCGPLMSKGHTANVILDKNNGTLDRMIIIFGHSPNLGYMNTVQEYYFETGEWNIISPSRHSLKGSYGHSASWDNLTQRIYVYGGIASEGGSSCYLNRNIYSYEPYTRIWSRLTVGPTARVLHSSAFVSGGLMFVFGGNSNIDLTGKTCYGSELYAYDVLCDSWSKLSIPTYLRADLARYGHSAVTYEGSMFIYGGFNGQMLSDMLKFTPGNCQFDGESICLESKTGLKCVWNSKKRFCSSALNFADNLVMTKNETIFCPKPTEHNIKKCNEIKHCSNCVTTPDCVWCGNYCSLDKTCSEVTTTNLLPISELAQCSLDPSSICKDLNTCESCTLQSACRWNIIEFTCAQKYSNTTVTVDVVKNTPCQNSCSEYESCQECTQSNCIWCHNEGRCSNLNAYIASYPYGQCREYTTAPGECRIKQRADHQCEYYQTCYKCRNDPACGWCDNGYGNGLGMCLPGGNAGPTLHNVTKSQYSCISEHWHFTTCPMCQCNGHANCMDNSSSCMPCNNHTTGKNCEVCMKGYWGNPENGGMCKECLCNQDAVDCDRNTGKCNCTTKGIIGDHCDKCDSANHYHYDASKESCFYELSTDYQYTFNLSKKQDQQYSRINFKNAPIKTDTDVDFQIICSKNAKLNISMRTENNEETLYENYSCSDVKSHLKIILEHDINATTFYAYIYDFQAPLWIQISFSQYPKLNLSQFFITLASVLAQPKYKMDCK